MLECTYKNEYNFTIDVVNKTITWNNKTDKLKQFINGITGEISSLAGVYNYSEATKGHSFFTPDIYKKDITACNDWSELEKLYTVLF